MTDEEKQAIAYLKFYIERDVMYEDTHYEQIKTILNLIENQQKEIESLKKENLEIRDWKYTIDTIEDLDKLKELDLIKIKGKEYISKDKIKAKIEEIDEVLKGNLIEKIRVYFEAQIEVLQSLLKEE